MGAPVVDASGLGRRFAGVTALDGIDLHIPAGASIAIFGPNGAGKTTLLRLLAMLLRPTTGTLRLFGETIADRGAAVRQRTGFLSHQSFLYPDLTPTQNLEFYARMYGIDDVEPRVRQWIDDVGLVGWAHRPVRTLSRGLEQRCALARALLHAPDLLLLDEPFTGLDASATAILTAHLRAAQQRGATVLMTTHDVARGCALCSHAVILAHGRVVWEGDVAHTPAEEVARLYEATTQRADGPTVARQ